MFGLSTRPLRRPTIILGSACAAALVAVVLARGVHTGSELRIAFLPIGAGAATVVELPGPGTRVMVIDAGPPAPDPEGAARRIADQLRLHRLRRIDVLVLTTREAARSPALRALARQYPVGELWWPGGDPAELGALESLPRRAVHAGMALAPMAGVQLSALAPVAPGSGSLVLALQHGARRIILASTASAAFALPADGPSPIDVLALPAGSPLEASALAPLGHLVLTGTTTAIRRAAGASPVWRTDRDGLIRVITDGTNLSVLGFRPTH